MNILANQMSTHRPPRVCGPHTVRPPLQGQTQRPAPPAEGVPVQQHLLRLLRVPDQLAHLSWDVGTCRY